MYCFALCIVLIGYCAVNSVCCAHDFCATPVLCRPTCSSTTPCTATGSTVTSASRTPRPFSSVRSRSLSSASGSPCYCFIQRWVKLSVHVVGWCLSCHNFKGTRRRSRAVRLVLTMSWSPPVSSLTRRRLRLTWRYKLLLDSSIAVIESLQFVCVLCLCSL